MSTNWVSGIERGAAHIAVKSIDIVTVSLRIYFILTVIALITTNLAPITT